MKPLDKVTGTLDALMAKGGEMRATPRHEGVGKVSDAVKWLQKNALESQFGYPNPVTAGLSELAGVPALQRTLERASYGEPLTNIGKANVPMLPEDTADILMNLAPLSGPALKGAGKGAGMVGKEALRQVARGMEGQGALSRLVAPAAPAYVVKPKGGNWLAGSIENEMSPMLAKTAGGTHMDKSLADMKALYTPESLAAMSPETRAMAERHMPELERGSAINKWIKGNLTNYVKNEMATPQDPLRALAEKGISHLRPEPPPEHRSLLLKKAREGTGFPPEGMGESDLAKQWEALSDRAVTGVPASHFQALEKYAVDKKMQEIQKTDDLYKELGLDPKESPPIKLPASHAYKENPWLAKLSEETPVYYSSPSSGLNQGFAHIVDVLKADLASGRIRPDQLNKVSMDQAVRRTVEYDQELAKKMEASRAASMEGMPVHKEYPEGYKWVELKRPGEFAQESDVMGHSVRGYEPASGSPDWITTSGDEGSEYYGHGGWEGIKSGKAKIYSLRNPKGESHATVEVAGSKTLTPEKREAQIANLMNRMLGEGMSQEKALEQATKLYPESETYPSITQIKGKQNRAPSEQYQPYIQDFVKSGQWSDVGDLSNTGLIKFNDKYLNRAEIEALSPEESDAFSSRNLGKPGYAAGGEVSRDQMMMKVEDQKFGIGGMVSKAAKAMKAAPAMEAKGLLSAAEREANLKQFLDTSRIKDRLYHATPKNFTEFKPGGPDPRVSGHATWLSNDPTRQPAMHNISGGQQSEFREGTNVMPVHVQAKNPLLLDDKDMLEWAQSVYAGGSREFPELMPKAWADEVKKDYDSIIHADPYGRGDPHEIIMFEPSKIKSAIGNRGTYDVTKGDINKAKGGAVKHPRHDEFVAKIKEKMSKVKKMAEGGAVDYNSTPDMADGGQLIQAPAYKAGGKVKRQVKISNNLDTMLMELSNKRNK